jgi:hypothetical protein
VGGDDLHDVQGPVDRWEVGGAYRIPR